MVPQSRKCWRPTLGRVTTVSISQELSHLPTSPPRSPIRRRLDAHPVIDSLAELLLASQVALGGLDRDVPKQKLNLIQFAAGKVTQPCASTAKVVRRKLLDPGPRRSLSHNFPKHLGRHSAAPDPANFVDRSKERALSDTAGLFPCVNRLLEPRWNRDGTDVSGLARKVGDYPVLLSQLDFIDTEREQLAAAESTSDEYGHDGVIPLAAERVAIRTRQEPLTLFCGEPVTDADSDVANSFHPPDPCSKLRT